MTEPAANTLTQNLTHELSNSSLVGEAQKLLHDTVESSITTFDKLPGTNVSVTAYNPLVVSLPNGDRGPRDYHNRLEMLSEAVSQSGGSEVFIAPEYFWNLNETLMTNFTSEERDRLVDALMTLSDDYPNKLIIPGTIVWSESGKIHNTAYIFIGKNLVSNDDLDRIKHCDKLDLGYEIKNYPALGWREGGGEDDKAGCIVKLGGEFVRVEICSDNGVKQDRKTAPDGGAEVDLSLVVACGIGEVLETTKVGGTTVVTDGGDGRSFFRVKEAPTEGTAAAEDVTQQDRIELLLPKYQGKFRGSFKSSEMLEYYIEKSEKERAASRD